MLERALRLRAPQPVGRDLDGAEAVALDAGEGVGHGKSPSLERPVDTFA